MAPVLIATAQMITTSARHVMPIRSVLVTHSISSFSISTQKCTSQSSETQPKGPQRLIPSRASIPAPPHPYGQILTHRTRPTTVTAMTRLTRRHMWWPMQIANGRPRSKISSNFPKQQYRQQHNPVDAHQTPRQKTRNNTKMIRRATPAPPTISIQMGRGFDGGVGPGGLGLVPGGNGGTGLGPGGKRRHAMPFTHVSPSWQP